MRSSDRTPFSRSRSCKRARRAPTRSRTARSSRTIRSAYAKQVNQTFALTPADVQRVAKRYLSAARVVMSMVPAGKLDLISKPDAAVHAT